MSVNRFTTTPMQCACCEVNLLVCDNVHKVLICPECDMTGQWQIVGPWTYGRWEDGGKGKGLLAGVDAPRQYLPIAAPRSERANYNRLAA